MSLARRKLLVPLAVVSLVLVSIGVTAIAFHDESHDGDTTTARTSIAVPAPPTQFAATKSRLMFCQPTMLLPDDAFGLVPRGLRVAYVPGTCKPVADSPLSVVNPDGSIGSAPWDSQMAAPFDTDRFVWMPLRYDVSGDVMILDGSYLAEAHLDAAAATPSVVLKFNQEGSILWHRLAKGLQGIPLTIFLNGEPLRTADGKVFSLTVGFDVTDSVVVNGLSAVDADHLVSAVTS